MRRSICFLLIAALLLSTVFCGCGILDKTVWLAMDCSVLLTGDTTSEAGVTPFCIDGLGYMSVNDLCRLFPSETADAGLTGESVQGADNAVFIENDVCLPIRELCGMCGIPVKSMGGVFALGRETAIDLETYAAICTAIGFDGFYDALPIKDVEHTVNPYVRYPYAQMCRDIDELCAMYPGLISKQVFGESAEGRELLSVTLGTGPREILLVSAIHGSEYYTTNFIMYVLDRYAYGYANDLSLEGLSYRDILDAVTITIVPQLNPDGVNIAQNGGSAAKDPASVYAMDMQGTWFAGWKANANGVDLNRNFPNRWCQENGINWPCARYFCGYAPATEPEVIAMMDLLDETPCYAFADFHTFGEKIYWYDTQNPQHEERYRSTMDRLFAVTEFEDFGLETVEKFAGYLTNYARNDKDCLSMTVELCSTWRLRGREELFDLSAEEPFPLPLILADEVLSFPHNGTRSATLNGRRIDLTGDATSSTFTKQEILCLVDACGIAYESTADGPLFIRGETQYLPISTPAEDAVSVVFDGTSVDIHALFAAFDIVTEMPDPYTLNLYYVA